MKKKTLMIAAAFVLVLCCIGIGAWAATNYGTQADPLIAQSYLDDVLRPQLEREFSRELDGAIDGLNAAAGEFVSVSLDAGGVSLGEGTEVLCLEAGAAASGTLVDVTAGGIVNAGETLSANHLYVAAGNGVLLTGTGEALVRGSYVAG